MCGGTKFWKFWTLQLYDLKFPNEIKMKKVELLIFFYANVHIYVKGLCFREDVGERRMVMWYYIYNYRDIRIFGKGNFLLWNIPSPLPSSKNTDLLPISLENVGFLMFLDRALGGSPGLRNFYQQQIEQNRPMWGAHPKIGNIWPPKLSTPKSCLRS